MENWDDVWRRNQFVCAELARRHAAMKVLFVGLPNDVSYQLRHGRVPERWSRESEGPAGLRNIRLMRPLKLLPNSWTPSRRVNEAMFRRQIGRAATAIGMRDPLLWLNPHSALHMAGRMGESAVIYDITDDWTTFTQSPRLTRLIVEQDAELCRRADAVIVCSERLREMKRALTDRLHLIPNGVDPGHYAGVLDRAGALPPEAAGWARPVFGYTGTVHPDRVDVELVEALSRKLARGSIALVGPNLLAADDVRRISSRGNVHVVGPVPYARVPEYMRAFDVCITPHRMTPFTESLNPIKLWEYLAAGKPIISTDVAGFRDYPHLVSIARTPEEFHRAMLAALTEDLGRSLARQAEARNHSWKARVDQIEAVIEGCLRRRQARGAREVTHVA